MVLEVVSLSLPQLNLSVKEWQSMMSIPMVCQEVGMWDLPAGSIPMLKQAAKLE